MERGSSFEELQRLARCLEQLDARGARRIVQRLRGTALPMLLRELSSAPSQRTQLAGDLLLAVADSDELRARAVRGLMGLTDRASDPIKTAALGLLRELGVTTAAPAFDDPETVKRRSAAALAAQLDSEADVAAAADLMTKRLDADELVSLLELMSETSPPQAARLARELGGRLDLDGDVRSEARRIAACSYLPSADAGAPTRRSPAAPRGRRDLRAAAEVCVLIGSGERDQRDRSHVIVATRRHGSQRRWRRLALLIDAGGVLEECLYEDDVPARELGAAEAAPLVQGLLAEGYRAVSRDLAHARTLATAAVQRAAALPHRLTSAYYLGRDILELGDLHLGSRPSTANLENAIGRAVDLFAAGDVERARQLAAACAREAPHNADVASTLGLCLLAAGELSEASEWLTRAASVEPTWPTHHWNLAAVHHRAGSHNACARALAAFLGASEQVSPRGAGLLDATHATRVALARRYLATHAPAADDPRAAAPPPPGRSRQRRRSRSSPARTRPD